MWCTRCHSDVAAELAENGQSLNCASCGHEIQKVYAPSLHPEIRSARELLERWSTEERVPPPPAAEPVPLPVASERIASNIPATTKPPASPPVSTFAAELLKALPESAAPKPSVPPASPNPTTVSVAGSDREATPLAAVNAVPPADKDTSADEVAKSGSGAMAGKPGEPPARRMLDRPAMARTAKPKTLWRADSAHQPGAAVEAEAAPRPVTPLASVDTGSPPPLPIRPPRAPFEVAKTTDAEAPPASKNTGSPAQALVGNSNPTHSRSESPRTESKKPVSPFVADSNGPRRSSPKRDGGDADGSRRRVDRASRQIAQPHFDLQTYLAQHPQKAGKSETVWGQLVAYIGVAVLTIGTTMVLWGYFGGLARYTSTGFLVSTAGQMLLFLGVVTLVSGGMQQTSNDVSARVEYLGDRMIRMEQATKKVLRSPHFARRRRRQDETARRTSQQQENDAA